MLIFLLSCSSNKETIQNDKEAYYFYFDSEAKSQLMKKYRGSKNGAMRYLFRLDNENIIFIQKDNSKKIEFSSDDSLEIDFKDVKWLNSFTSIERDRFFLKKSNKRYYIVEKDTMNRKLYLFNVDFIQEID